MEIHDEDVILWINEVTVPSYHVLVSKAQTPRLYLIDRVCVLVRLIRSLVPCPNVYAHMHLELGSPSPVIEMSFDQAMIHHEAE